VSDIERSGDASLWQEDATWIELADRRDRVR
jgi:hypothetical protein